MKDQRTTNTRLRRMIVPAGWFMNAWNLDPVAAAAAPDMMKTVVLAIN